MRGESQPVGGVVKNFFSFFFSSSRRDGGSSQGGRNPNQNGAANHHGLVNGVGGDNHFVSTSDGAMLLDNESVGLASNGLRNASDHPVVT